MSICIPKNIQLMKLKPILVTSLSLLTPLGAPAALVQWQAAVGTGAAAAATQFSTVTSPITLSVGTLTGDRSFEFIVNAATGVTPSSALLGNFAVEGGKQGLKFEQFNKTGKIAMTTFGVEDFNTAVAAPSGLNSQIVFVFDGTKTSLYVNGAFQATILGAGGADVALALTGTQGLGGALNGAAYVDPLQGSILGFASYDSTLSAAEIKTHYDAFASPVPEAGTTGLAGLAVMGCLLRRRRQA